MTRLKKNISEANSGGLRWKYWHSPTDHLVTQKSSTSLNDNAHQKLISECLFPYLDIHRNTCIKFVTFCYYSKPFWHGDNFENTWWKNTGRQ